MNVYNILASSTKLLLKEVLTATKKKFMEKASSVIQCKYKIPVEVYSKAAASYNFVFNLAS